MKGNFLSRKRLIKAILFLLRFNFLAIPMYAVMYLNFSFAPLQNFLAYLIFKTLKTIGYNVLINGYFLIYQNQIIDISWDSTGWKSLYTMAALVVAAPLSNFSKKIKFLFFALPTLFLINFLRILTTILVSIKFGFKYFEIVHTFLWREGLIAAVIAIWVLYLTKTKI